jgi:hypothetical protein
MSKARTILVLALLSASICGLSVGVARAFHGGHTGVTESQLKAACPAFGTGTVMLFDSVAPPGNLPMTDVFEHESGARCTCTRQRTDRHSLRCGPAAPRR